MVIDLGGCFGRFNGVVDLGAAYQQSCLFFNDATWHSLRRN
jgi:hypothetical protein